MKHKEWITEDISDMMDKRKKFKNKDKSKYKEIEEVTGKKVNVAEGAWLNEKCIKIEGKKSKQF